MAAKQIYVNENASLKLKDATLNPLPEGWVRVKPFAVAVNPTDHKHCIYKFAEGLSNGSDFAGEVIEVGPNVSDIKVGDHIAGVAAGGNPEMPEGGAYATSIDVPPNSAFRFPKLELHREQKHFESTVPTTFEQASTLGIGVGTAAIAFAHYNKTPLVRNSVKGHALVYGAAGSLGFQVVQFAKYLGYEVIAVASKKHESLLRSIGAAHVVDYHDKDWVEQVRKIGGDDIQYAYDTISCNETFHPVYEAVSHTKPVKINLSLWSVDEPEKKRDNVKWDVPLLYLLWAKQKLFGKVVIPGIPELVAARPQIIAKINEMLADGDIKSIPADVVGESFEEIPNLFTEFAKGASGNKFVVRY